MKKSTDNFGFSLVELMVVVAIIAILAVALAPMLPWQRQNVQFRTVSNDLFTDIQLAKMTAIKENANVVAAITAGGYTIFVDDGAGGGAAGDDIRNGTERTIRSVNMPNNVTLTVPANVLAFLPTGLLKNGNMNTDIADGNINRTASLTVSLAGVIQFEEIK